MTVHQPIIADAGQHAWKVRREDFLLLEANGSFQGYVRTELLDGEIWVVNAIHSRHASVQAELHGRLWAALNALGSPLKTYIAPSVDLSGSSLPEPDLVLGAPHHDGFVPLAKVALMVEVSDTTLETDLDRKQRIYAAAGIPEYWVADVNGRVLHRMSSPSGDTYLHHDEIMFGQKLHAATIDGLILDTDGL